MFYRLLVTDSVPKYYGCEYEQGLLFDFQDEEDAIDLLDTMVVKYGKDAAIIKIDSE